MSKEAEKVLGAFEKAMLAGIESALVHWKSPMDHIIKDAIDKHEGQLSKMAEEAINEAMGLNMDSMKQAIREKMAKIIVSKAGGEIEKKVNELKSNPETRAKITTAIVAALKAIEADNTTKDADNE